MKLTVQSGMLTLVLSLVGISARYNAHALPAKLVTALPPLVTNALPKSVFLVPGTEPGVHDPFFPKSDRLKQAGTPKEIVDPTPSLTLIFNGLSGPENHKLAIINGRSLAEGEEAEIVVGSSRVKISCVEIKGETVTVEALGHRYDLQLGKRK